MIKRLLLLLLLAIMLTPDPGEAATCASNENSGTPAITTPPQNGTCLKGPCPGDMCFVPPGEFVLGAARSQIDDIFNTCKDEWYDTLRGEPLLAQNPTASIYTDALCMDRTEVARGQYRQIMGELPPQPSACKGDACPATGMEWSDATRYCATVQKHLPSEQEWEKAARGALGALYPWGDLAPNCARAHTTDCGPSPIDVTAHPEGASAYGILNAAGNAAEWTADCFDPNAGPECSRTVRGGSWNDPPWRMYAFFRVDSDKYASAGDVGFRCAFTPYTAGGDSSGKQFAPEAAALAACLESRRQLDARYARLFNEFVSVSREMLDDQAPYMGASGAAMEDLVMRVQRLEQAYERLACDAHDSENRYADALSLMKSACGELRQTMKAFDSYFDAGNSKYLKTYNETLMELNSKNKDIASLWQTERKSFGLNAIDVQPVQLEE